MNVNLLFMSITMDASHKANTEEKKPDTRKVRFYLQSEEWTKISYGVEGQDGRALWGGGESSNWKGV